MPDAQVYLLQGEEDLLIDQALAVLLDRLMPAEERDLNLDVLREFFVPVRIELSGQTIYQSEAV